MLILAQKVETTHDLASIFMSGHMYMLCAEEVGIPTPAEFATEADADRVLCQKMAEVMELLEQRCPARHLNPRAVADWVQGLYFQSRGWIVDEAGIQTGQTLERRSSR